MAKAVVLTLSVLFIGAGGASARPMMPPMMEQIERLAGPGLEVAFMSMMVGHHEGAITMARLAVARGSRPEVRAAAEKIVRDQSAEIRILAAWLREWYQQAPEQRQVMEMQEMGAMMRRPLEALQGPAFDTAFLRAMIEHHSQAIAMARPVTAKAVHDRLQALAWNVILTQSQEIAQFQAWLRTWGAP